jgi:hypothetical protein
MVRDANHLRRASEAEKRLLPDGHQGSPDGQHHVPCALEARRAVAPPDLPHPRPGLRRARPPVHRQRGAQERRRPVQRQPVDYPERDGRQARARQPVPESRAFQHPAGRCVLDGMSWDYPVVSFFLC